MSTRTAKILKFEPVKKKLERDSKNPLRPSTASTKMKNLSKRFSNQFTE